MNAEGQNCHLTIANMPVFGAPKAITTPKANIPKTFVSKGDVLTTNSEPIVGSQNSCKINDPKPIPEYDVRSLIGPTKKSKTPILVAAITIFIIILVSASILYFRNKSANKISSINSSYSLAE